MAIQGNTLTDEASEAREIVCCSRDIPDESDTSVYSNGQIQAQVISSFDNICINYASCIGISWQYL